MLPDRSDCHTGYGGRSMEQFFTDFVLSWLFLILTVVGLIGSSLCLAVLARFPVFGRTAKYWFCSLLVTDILLLLFPGMDLYFYLIFPQHYPNFLSNIGAAGCEIRYAFIQSLSWLGNLLQSSLSIERSYSVLRPMQARFLFTKPRTKCIIFGLVVISFVSGIITNGLTFTRSAVDNSTNNCSRIQMDIASINISNIIYKIDLFLFRAIPFLIMLTCSCIIIVELRFCQRQRHSLATRHRQSSVNSQKEFKMFILLISMNCLTLLTNPLFALFELIDGVGSEGHEYGLVTGNKCISDLLRLIFNCFIYLNNQTNWIFYIANGAKFRRYSLIILRRLCTSSSPTNVGSIRYKHRDMTNASCDLSMSIQPRKYYQEQCFY